MKLVSLLFALVACGGAPENASPEADDGEPKLTHVRLALNWFAEPEFGGFYQGVCPTLDTRDEALKALQATLGMAP